MEANEIKLRDWQVPLAEHQTRVLKTERVMLSACHTGCLASGTPVRMFDGTVKSVEDVKPGDVVESFDEITGVIYPNKVSDNIRTCHKPKPMIQYTYENETIRTTYDHYFFVDERGFVPLYQLAWRAMEADQRIQLELLCKRYGTPLDLDSPWWKTAFSNEASKGRERLLPYRPERQDCEGSPHSGGELAVEPLGATLCESYRFQPNEQSGGKSGMVLGEVQCVVWNTPWKDKGSETSEAGPGTGERQKIGDGGSAEAFLDSTEGQARTPETRTERHSGDVLHETREEIPGTLEGKGQDRAELGTGEIVSFVVCEAEPYYTISLERAPYAYCIGREHRFPVHNSGKTYLACQTVKDLGLKTLVVCPKIAISQWRNVIEGMGAKDYVIDVVNPERLVASKNNPFYDNDEGWTFDAKEPMLVVWDECHRGCSGVDSKQTLALARWCNKFHPDNKVLAMSATPFETPMKLRCLGYLMGFHRFTQDSFYQWCKNHGCGYADIGWGRTRRRIFRFTVHKGRAEEIMRIIRKDMGERFMSVGPDEIPGFPDEVKEVLLLDLAKKDHDALVNAYAEMPDRIKHLSEDDMVKMLRLRQQAEFCKAEAIAEMAVGLEEDGYSVFIMVNFTDARLRIEEYFKKKGIEYASIYGGQKDSERQSGIEAFQSNRTHVIIGMAAACSVALSLHDERHERPRVSLISPGYSASEFSQGLGRIRRVGGTTAVQKIVIAAGSVEERVGKSIERKMENLSALTDRDLMR